MDWTLDSGLWTLDSGDLRKIDVGCRVDILAQLGVENLVAFERVSTAVQCLFGEHMLSL